METARISKTISVIIARAAAKPTKTRPDAVYQTVRLRAAQQPGDDIGDHDAAKQGDDIRPVVRMSHIGLQFFRRVCECPPARVL